MKTPHREPDEIAGERRVCAVAAVVCGDAGEVEEHAHVVVGEVVARHVVVDSVSQAGTRNCKPFVHATTLLSHPVGGDP